ncbi:MAG: hypothetical protein M1365_02310 [Actinobacteria bacterium]|nr:hypothetical protein [Actinomycetota bacterium]
MIALQVSLYPIGENDLDKPLNAFWQVLKDENIKYKICPLSTIAWDEDEEKLYNGVYKAYKKAREICRAVMVTTLTTGKIDEINVLLEYVK